MPVVTLKMGSSLNPDDIKEGADVYFECLILSNPKPYKMTWYHNVSIPRSSQRARSSWFMHNREDISTTPQTLSCSYKTNRFYRNQLPRFI